MFIFTFSWPHFTSKTHKKTFVPRNTFIKVALYFLLSVPINEIKEVRVGKNTDVLRNKDIAGHYPDECAFSIIYTDSFETMDLIANTPDEVNIWVTGLTCLISGKNSEYRGLYFSNWKNECSMKWRIQSRNWCNRPNYTHPQNITLGMVWLTKTAGKM